MSGSKIGENQRKFTKLFEIQGKNPFVQKSFSSFAWIFINLLIFCNDHISFSKKCQDPACLIYIIKHDYL